MTAHLHRHTQTHSHTHTLTHAHQQQQQFPRPRTTNASGSSVHRTHALKQSWLQWRQSNLYIKRTQRHSCQWSSAQAHCTGRFHFALAYRRRSAGLSPHRCCLFWLALTTCWFALALALASTTRTVSSPLPSSFAGFSPHVPLLRRPIQRAVAARVIGLRLRHRRCRPWAQPMDALWKVGG